MSKLFVLLPVLALAGCGGGGGSSSPAVPTVTASPSPVPAQPTPITGQTLAPTPTTAPTQISTIAPTTAPTPQVYSPIGVFRGNVIGLYNDPGVVTLGVNSDGSGDFQTNFNGYTPVILSFQATNTYISGSNFSIVPSQFMLQGQPSGCLFSLQTNMVNANEMDGSYTLSCNNQVATIPLKLLRLGVQVQDVIRQDLAIPLQHKI